MESKYDGKIWINIKNSNYKYSFQERNNEMNIKNSVLIKLKGNEEQERNRKINK